MESGSTESFGNCCLTLSIHEFLRFLVSSLDSSQQLELRAILLDLPASTLGAPLGILARLTESRSKTPEGNSFRVLLDVYTDVRNGVSYSMSF